LLYVAAAFDHGLLNDGIHKWVARRWNAFYVAANSAVARFISLWVVPIRGIYTWSFHRSPGWDYKPMWWWFATNLFLICILIPIAIWSWKETMGMLEFASQPGRDVFSGPDVASEQPPQKDFEAVQPEQG
jgi:hypothetical protein